MVNEEGTPAMRSICVILSILSLSLSVIPNLSAQKTISDTSRVGLLNWGDNPVSGQPWTISDLNNLAKSRVRSPVGKEVQNILHSAHREFEQTDPVEHPLERIEMEGVLPTRN
jgi:hypothetical protein